QHAEIRARKPRASRRWLGRRPVLVGAVVHGVLSATAEAPLATVREPADVEAGIVAAEGRLEARPLTAPNPTAPAAPPPLESRSPANAAAKPASHRPRAPPSALRHRATTQRASTSPRRAFAPPSPDRACRACRVACRARSCRSPRWRSRLRRADLASRARARAQ